MQLTKSFTKEAGFSTNEVSEVQAKILQQLLIDGRKTVTEIAEATGLQEEIIYENCRSMKQTGIIQGATIHINYRGFGYKAVANLLIIVEPTQADQIIEHIKKMQDIYAVYGYGPKGNIRIVTTLKTLQQLDQVKDAIKQKFTILSMKTVIWTDVKEMHQNLALSQQRKTKAHEKQQQVKVEKREAVKQKNIEIDETDLKIAEILSKNGFAPLSKIAKEIGISTSKAKRKYEILKKNGLLKVTVQINLTKIGYRAMAVYYLTFALNEDSTSTIEKISRIPDVISIMKTSGDYDLQVYAMIRDIDELLAIQDEFSRIGGIAKIDMDISKVLNKWPTPRQYISTF